MKRVLAQIRRLVWALVIIGVFLTLMGQVIGFGLLVSLMIYFTLDSTSRLFFPLSQRELNIQQGFCPECGHDLSNIGTGQTTCPNCDEAVPATLRKWGSR